MIIKEGQKVNANYTAKICLWSFYGDLLQGSQIFHIKYNLKTLVFHLKNAWFYPFQAYYGYFVPPLGLLRASMTFKKNPRDTDWATWFGKSSICGFYCLEDVVEEKIKNLVLKSGFEAVFDFKLICFTKYAPYDLLAMIYPILWPNCYL